MTDQANETILATRQDAILTITLNRPDAMNALRPEMLERLCALVEGAGEDVAAIVLQGAGRCFSAGVDLKVLQGITPVAGQIAGALDEPARRLGRLIAAAPMPVIAKVHGFCFTGALEIALRCDMIYTTAETKFGDTHTKFGLRPSWGMSQTLSRAVGLRRAKELSFTARTFSGADAAAWGLANAALPDKEALDGHVQDICTRIVANSVAAVRAGKDLYRLAEQDLPLEDAIEEEVRRTYPEITDTADRLKGF